MRIYSKQDAISYMNEKGRAGTPFLFIINYKADEIYLFESNEIDPREMLYDFNGFSNSPEKIDDAEKPEWIIEPVSFPIYEKAFEQVVCEIKAGNSYLLNLTFPTKVVTDQSLRTVFLRARAPYRLWIKERFVCFSPEIFVKIADNTIRSFPMKGTIDADLPDAAKRILADKKEEAEHATIVDLIRNDLSRVASEVRVAKYRFLDTLITNRGRLLQISSEVEGKLSNDWQGRIGDILFELLPAGSISGAPKKKTLEIIQAAEPDERGFYTGVAGCFDGQRLDSTVLIRFIEQRGDDFFFRSGGGITAKSNAQQEYDEIKQKVYVPIY